MGEALNSSCLVLTWMPLSEDQLNGILTGYLVNVTEAETGTLYQVSSAEEAYIFKNLHPFYRYSFIVAALTIGPGPFSEVVAVVMPQDGMYNVYTLHAVYLYLLHFSQLLLAPLKMLREWFSIPLHCLFIGDHLHLKTRMGS